MFAGTTVSSLVVSEFRGGGDHLWDDLLPYVGWLHSGVRWHYDEWIFYLAALLNFDHTGSQIEDRNTVVLKIQSRPLISKIFFRAHTKFIISQPHSLIRIEIRKLKQLFFGILIWTA